MRIAILIDDASRGGLQRHMLALRDELRARSHSCEVVYCGASSRFSTESYGSSLTHVAAGDLVTTLNSFDVLFNTGCTILRSLGESIRSPTVEFFWGGLATPVFTWAKAQKFVTCNNFIATALETLVPRTRPHIHTLNNPLTFRLETESDTLEAEASAWRKQNNISEDAFVVIALGRFTPVKRHLRLIYEVASFLNDDSKSVLVICGSSGMTDGAQWISTYEACSAAISQLGLAGRIKLIDFVDRPEIVLKASNVYVSFSESEGQSISTSEAQSLGLPVVVTAVGGTERQITTCSPNGILLPVYGRTPLASHLWDLRCDSAYAKRLSEAAKVHATANCNLHSYASNVESILREAKDSQPIHNPINVSQIEGCRLLIITYGTIQKVSPRLRAFYMARCLACYGVVVKVMDVEEVDTDDITAADIVVFHRVSQCLLKTSAGSRERRKLYKRIQFLWEFSLRRVPTGYDMDDYVFFPDSCPDGIAAENCGFLESATFVIANSNAAARRFKRYNACIFIVENPVDELLWQRRVWPRLNERFTVTWVAGNTHGADIIVFNAILEELEKMRVDCQVVMLGEEPEEMAISARKLLKHVPTLPYYSVPAVLSQADISLSPLRNTEENHCKGHGHIAEPAMLGVLSIAQNTESYRELGLDGTNGFLVNDAQECAALIARLSKDLAAVRKIGNQAKAIYSPRFGMPRIGFEYTRILSSAFANGG